jgi:hypothetical protein
MKRSPYVLGILAYLVTPSLAFAQMQSSLTFFHSVNATYPAPTAEFIKDIIVVKFSLGTSGLPASCKPGGAITVTEIKPATADRMVWKAALAGEIKNAWTAKVELGGCGEAPVNYLVVTDKNGKTSAGPFSWGQSLAGISLTRDVMPAAAGALASNMKKVDAECSLERLKKFAPGPRQIQDMRTVGEDVYGVRFKGNWSEIWHFTVCDYDVGIPINFRADGSGGAYFDAGSGVTARKL